MKTEDGSFTPALLLATGLLMVRAFPVSRMRYTGQEHAAEVKPAHAARLVKATIRKQAVHPAACFLGSS